MVKKSNNIKNEKKKKLNIFIVFVISIFYMEIVFHVTTFGIANVLSLKTLYSLLFAVMTSMILCYVSLLGGKKHKKKVAISLILVLGLFYFGIYMFKSLFNTFFSFHLLGVSDQAAAFIGDALLEMLKRIPILLLFILPFIFVLIYKRNLSCERNKSKRLNDLIIFISSFILFMLITLFVPYINELFYKVDNNAMNVEKLGVNVATYLDIKRIFFPIKEELLTENLNTSTIDGNTDIVYEPNMMDIDFNSLMENTSNKNLKELHEFFNNQTPTYKNEYTGLYEGKNLIVFMGESLNDIAVSEKYTPTLYKLSHEGFEFTNFYTPVNLSTLGGEFQTQTGLFANLSMLSQKFRQGTNYYPFGIGNVFTNLGYDVSAYHANSGYFQSRNVYLKSLGYPKFLFNGNGLEKLMNCNLWPQSDYDMVNVTIDDIINQDKFMAYYVGVSGHMAWSFAENNMSRRNKEAVLDMNKSEEAEAYVASNIELDKAVELTIKKLEEIGKLDDTVIAIVPDHYPYSMNINSINELSSYKRDERFEVNHSTLILWNSKQEHKVIDKIF